MFLATDPLSAVLCRDTALGLMTDSASHLSFLLGHWKKTVKLIHSSTTQRSFGLSKLCSKLGIVAVITALGRLRQDDHKFKASLGYNKQQLKQK